MNFLKTAFLILFLFPLLSPVLSGVAHAQGLPSILPDCSPTGSGGKAKCTFAHLLELVRNLVRWLTVIAIPLAIIFIAYGGFVIMTAGGDEGRLGQGKKILTSAVIGLVITFSAWLVVNTFFKFFIKEGQVIEKVEQF